jgi:eukaryotic-like serine/threonine-protein kinase
MQQTEKQRIGRYEIVEEIGRGAMGVVFKARDPLIGRDVAVKTITSGVAESADLLERFYREAQAAGGLQHPNIVTIYELAESGGAPFIAMEYLEGESLEKVIAGKPALPLATKVGYVLQTCRALDYAHRRGVIHRDVKPANIMVTREGMVKVVDFGIARLADTSKTQTGTLVGTLAYMSPERVRGEQADARGDIWALGVVLYELLAYQRPFNGENHAALLLNILQNEPPSIRQFLPECPAALERVIQKSLRKDEKERYPSMEALLKNLENVNSSLMRGGSPAVGAAPQTPGANPNPQPAPTVLLAASPIRPGASPAGATPVAGAGARPSVKTIPAQSSRPASHLGRNVVATFAILVIIALGSLAVVRRDEAFAKTAHLAWTKIIHSAAVRGLAGPWRAGIANAPAPAASPVVVAQPAMPVADVTPASDPADQPAPASGSSIEDQQRYLIGLAQAAADRQDYKGALEQLDQAAALNGPLNDNVADLRRQFNAQSQGLELERVAEQEQTLWDKAMAYLNAGDLDDAEESLRDILTLPEGGHRWTEAARYVDQVIPERHREEQLWGAAQLASASRDPGHFLSEMKALDEVLAAGGRHEPGARQKRDSAYTALIHDDAERHRTPEPAVSNADQWQMTRLKNHFDDLVQKGDRAALEELQKLQAGFKSVADAQGPLALDALDYLNNVIPNAQKHIEDRLALADSNASPNAAYVNAIMEYNHAVATKDTAALRNKVLPMFRQMAQSGEVRAREAQRYADVLLPAALKEIQTSK